MHASHLLPHLSAFRITDGALAENRLVLDVVPKQRSAPCPLCGRCSRRIHSRYVRSVHDLPCCGVPVLLRLHARRFVCRNRQCARRIFCERVPTLVPPRCRRTERLTQALIEIGFATGGEGGSRLAGALSMTASPAHLLRLLRRAPAAPEELVRVVGVDDWAKRKGKSYGTILVDLERRCPIDLLPDRTSDTLADWLREHTGVEVLSRDRGKDYAEGGRLGAPEAVQVADRWHLFKNLGDVLERVMTREHRRLRDAAAQVAETRPTDPPPEHELTRAEREKRERRARRVQRYETVQELKAKGLSVSAIARATGLTWITAKKLASAPSFPERVVRRPGPVSVIPYDAHLRKRWEVGCRNAEQLWRELREMGYQGSDQTVRRYIASWRWADPPLPTGTPRFQPYSPRHVAWMLMQRSDTLSLEEVDYLDHLQTDEQIADLYDLTQTYCRMIRDRDAACLDIWLGAATTSHFRELRGFATHLQQDHAAVRAALSLPWSNGQTEGQITRDHGVSPCATQLLRQEGKGVCRCFGRCVEASAALYQGPRGGPSLACWEQRDEMFRDERGPA
jgi:transposase